MSPHPTGAPGRQPPEDKSPAGASGSTAQQADDLEPTRGASRASHHQLGATLDEGQAEAEIVRRLLAAGVDGDDFNDADPEWRQLATRLIKYGYPVLVAWGVTGELPKKVESVALYGGRRLPEELNKDDAHALAVEVLEVAIKKFRTSSLRTWSPTGGATLHSYFIGCCLLVAGQAYEGWYRRERRPLPLDLRFVDDGRDGRRPDEAAEASVLVDQLLAGDPVLRRVLELQGQGYSLDEIAGNLGTTSKRLKSRTYRARQRIQKGGRGGG